MWVSYAIRDMSVRLRTPVMMPSSNRPHVGRYDRSAFQPVAAASVGVFAAARRLRSQESQFARLPVLRDMLIYPELSGRSD